MSQAKKEFTREDLERVRREERRAVANFLRQWTRYREPDVFEEGTDDTTYRVVFEDIRADIDFEDDDRGIENLSASFEAKLPVLMKIHTRHTMETLDVEGLFEEIASDVEDGKHASDFWSLPR
jgi:hypothetical protein